jgi:hypothetical protein
MQFKVKVHESERESESQREKGLHRGHMVNGLVWGERCQCVMLSDNRPSEPCKITVQKLLSISRDIKQYGHRRGTCSRIRRNYDSDSKKSYVHEASAESCEGDARCNGRNKFASLMISSA